MGVKSRVEDHCLPARLVSWNDGYVDRRAIERERMVVEQLASRDIVDERVLSAMTGVPRHEFVDDGLNDQAYSDGALPIGEQQTISQPYIVALTCQAMALEPDARVLEVGTGSGYAAAVLSRLAERVYTIERHQTLASRASERLQALGYDNVEVRCGDGADGWLSEAPFDAIAVAAAASKIPTSLLEQLAEGGRLVIPVGEQGRSQELRLITRAGSVFEERSLCQVRFVPLVR
jgi:protein-L-isoaspartate(D-aspartate) O-methyltransferase